LLAQILADVCALTVVLFLTGGATNPFVSLYLLPIIFAAVTLRAALAWSVAGVCAMAYSVMLFWYVPLAIPVERSVMAFHLHVFGMWTNFLATASLVAFFITRMTRAVSERDRALGQAREEHLRNERIVAMGALAAGAAHELSTPLSTLAVVAHEVERDHARTPDLAASMRIIGDQVGVMKEILTRLAAQAGRARAEGGAPRFVDGFVAELIEAWKLMRPEAVVTSVFPDAGRAPLVFADEALAQALIVIFNNAADVSPDEVTVSVDWDERELLVSVLDRGPGLTREIPPGIKHGMGVGLMLANSTVERFGGEVRASDREGGGARVDVRLPIRRPGA
jgi:two-component system sensor histidine kinase RegB